MREVLLHRGGPLDRDDAPASWLAAVTSFRAWNDVAAGCAVLPAPSPPPSSSSAAAPASAAPASAACCSSDKSSSSSSSSKHEKLRASPSSSSSPSSPPAVFAASSAGGESCGFSPRRPKKPRDRDRLLSFFFFSEAVPLSPAAPLDRLLLVSSRFRENHERGFFFPVNGSTYTKVAHRTPRATT